MRRQSSFVVRLARMRDAKKNVRARRKKKKKTEDPSRPKHEKPDSGKRRNDREPRGVRLVRRGGSGGPTGVGTYLPLKLASFAALLGALMSFTPVSISACLVGVRANPSEALACSSPPIARLAFGARAVMEKHAREGAFSP
jgi:hypothetical protein